MLCKTKQERVNVTTELYQYPVRKVCRMMNVTLSAYYHKKNYKKKPKYTEAELQAVEKVYMKHCGNFGRRVIRRELLKDGIVMSEKKITKIMKLLNLKSKHHKRKCKNVYTDEEAAKKYIRENTYAQLSEEQKQQEIWSMDFTEEKIEGKTIYSCGIVAVNSKILISRITGKPNTKETAIETLVQGILRYGVPYMVMTDRGSPFVSREFYDTVERYGIVHSMSRPHTPVDNRYIETFWKSMKTEIGNVKHLTLSNYLVIMEYYEYYYNFERPHSSLGYRTPRQLTPATPQQPTHTTVISNDV